MAENNVTQEVVEAPVTQVPEPPAPVVTPPATFVGGAGADINQGEAEQRTLESSFGGLTDSQRSQFPDQQAFGSAVKAEQDRLGINQDVAIGNLLSKQREPFSGSSSERGREEVEKMQGELAEIEGQGAGFVPEVAPPALGLEGDVLTEDLQSELDTANTQIDLEFQQSFDLLEAQKRNMDANTAAMISDIQRSMGRARDQQRVTNKNRLKGLEIIGSRTGRQRFAAEIQSSILGAEERAGIQAIADINAQEQELIRQARQANDEGSFTLLRERMSLMGQAREAKRAAVKDLFDKMVTLENIALNRAQEKRSQAEFEIGIQANERAKFFEDLERSPESISSLPPEQKQQIERDLNLPPNSIDEIIETGIAIKGAELENLEIEKVESLVNLLNKIPAGEQITIGDNTYSGLDSPFSKTWLEESADGSVKGVKFNEITGTFDVEDLGFKGPQKNTSSTSRSTVSSEKISERSSAPLTEHNLDAFMFAMGVQESGGNYNAENGRTGASGKFQILPDNWGPWSQEYLQATGQAPQTLDPGNPNNQEAVAAFKMNQYYEKYGSWEDVASMWYSGRPFSQVVAEGWADNKQGNGNEPSVREYVNSVISKFEPTFTGSAGSQDSASEFERREQAKALQDDYTRSQVGKLEAAGLLFASRDEQIQFLFGEDEEDEGDDDVNIY